MSPIFLPLECVAGLFLWFSPDVMATTYSPASLAPTHLYRRRILTAMRNDNEHIILIPVNML